MGNLPRVLAVVLNWNGREMTSRCVEHLRRQDYPALDVLVVDNGSTDGSEAALAGAGLRPGEFHRLDENRGFTGGMNAGVRRARDGGYAHVWLLNNDAFPDPGCLSALVRRLDRDPAAGMVTPRLVGADGLDQHVGGTLRPDGCTSDWVYADDPFPEDAWVTGTAPLVRLACLEEVGLFDERFFAYWEDIDLSVRCLRAGWGLGCEPSARCVHLGGGSSDGLQSPFCSHVAVRNAGLFWCKHLPWASRPGYLLRLFSHVAGRAASESHCGRAALASATVGGFTAILAGASGRPSRLTASPRLERFVLKHWWGLGRLARALSRFLPSSTLRFGLATPGRVPGPCLGRKAATS